MPEAIDVNEIPRFDPYSPATRTIKSELGKDDFLRLFVTRLQHQDPLSPMDDAEFIAQLAQFSSLEQLTNINDTLASGMGLGEELAPLATLGAIYDRLGENQQYSMLLVQTINNTMAAALIGRTVKCQVNTIALPLSGNVDVHYRLDGEAKTVVAKIYDGQGHLVRVLSAGTTSPGEQKFSWDGKDTEGIRLAAGQYNVEIIATDASGNQVSATTVYKGKVDSIKYIEGQAYLDVDGVLVSLADVREISAE